MNTEQEKLLHVRISCLKSSIKALKEASSSAFQALDFRASNKLDEYRRGLEIELRLAEHEYTKVDLF